MAEPTENTFTAYLGPEFQQKLMWQLLVEPEFAEKAIPNLSVDYFDDPNLKRLYIIILEFYHEYGKVPNLQNKSIHAAINKYKTPNNKIEEESLFSVINRVELWNERIINKQTLHDGEVVQKETTTFIKQQEWRKFAEYILEKTKNGEIKKKYTLGEIDERLVKISHIGDDEDYGTEITENIEKALRKEFRKTLPTGVSVIDTLTGGGLGKGEIGLILTPSGVGKTTMLTKIANTAYELEYNVCQIVFEDTVEQIQRKHYTIWTKYPLSKIDENNKTVEKLVKEKIENSKNRGHLVIKRFSQENTTMMDIRNWITRYQKKWGYTFDLVVLDYLDCLESHKKSVDRNEAELAIIKSFEAMAADFDIPAWTAIQSNRSGFDAEFVEAHQTGGSIKRIQKAHFFMSVAKTPDQKEAQLANIRIIKARFAQDGQTFQDCRFNNDTLEIVIEDSRYANAKPYRGLKKYDSSDVEDLEVKADKTHEIPEEEKPSMNVILHSHISNFEEEVIKKANSDTVNDTVNEIEVKNNEQTENVMPEIPERIIDNVFTAATNETVIITDVDEIPIEKEDLLEIDETVKDNDGFSIEIPIQKAIYIEETTEIIEDVYEWSGESYTVNTIKNEVKIEDVKPIEAPKLEEKQEIVDNLTTKTENIFENFTKNFNDPDAPSDACAQVMDKLKSMEKQQGEIKKE